MEIEPPTSEIFDGIQGVRRAGASRKPRGDLPHRRRRVSPLVALLSLALSLTSLVLAFLSGTFMSPAEALREYFRETTPHEAYLTGLSRAGLTSTALGRDWVEASREALRAPLTIEAPFLEEGFFPPEEALALGYRLELRRGQRVTVEVEMPGDPGARLFVDLFRAAPDSLQPPVHLQSPQPGEPLAFLPRRSGEYLLRVQPELLRGGRFRIVVASEAALAFPVSGRDRNAIQSFFGAPRDGGRRRHHGVDIFAPRGTPVVAASEAYVSRVDTTRVGGRVIWLRDNRLRASIYYAHLNTILTREGTRVRPGDTLGTVGNTGNARTTPPHLHFGLYFRGEGPYDPWDYLVQPRSPLPPVEVSLAGLGRWARTRGDAIRVRSRPSAGSAVVEDLPRHTALRVMGGVGSWFRIRLPDGRPGFVAGSLAEGVDEPLWLERTVGATPLRAGPTPTSPTMVELPVGSELPVLGTFGDFMLVRPPGERAGWVSLSNPALDR